MYYLPKSVIEEISGYVQKQKELLECYKAKNNFEMIYLVKWTILEKIVKEIASQHRRVKLKESLESWISYLDKNDKKPTEINNFSIDSLNLPHERELKEALKYYFLDSEKVWEVMNSKGIYRKYRNKLAHDAEAISETRFNKLFPELESLVDYFVKELKI
jgi:hypothetical protein